MLKYFVERCNQTPKLKQVATEYARYLGHPLRWEMKFPDTRLAIVVFERAPYFRRNGRRIALEAAYPHE
jgi:hypothetical protein